MGANAARKCCCAKITCAPCTRSIPRYIAIEFDGIDLSNNGRIVPFDGSDPLFPTHPPVYDTHGCIDGSDDDSIQVGISASINSTRFCLEHVSGCLYRAYIADSSYFITAAGITDTGLIIEVVLFESITAWIPSRYIMRNTGIGDYFVFRAEFSAEDLPEDFCDDDHLTFDTANQLPDPGDFEGELPGWGRASGAGGNSFDDGGTATVDISGESPCANETSPQQCAVGDHDADTIVLHVNACGGFPDVEGDYPFHWDEGANAYLNDDAGFTIKCFSRGEDGVSSGYFWEMNLGDIGRLYAPRSGTSVPEFGWIVCRSPSCTSLDVTVTEDLP